MTEPNLEELLAQAVNRHRTHRWDDETRRRRFTEQGWRGATASSRAKSALTRLHPDDYRSLYLQAIQSINAERGPLPGDKDGAL